jgi:hypothetical protein
LIDRAKFLAELKPECLPTTFQFSDPGFRRATIGDFQITAGLLTMAVAERMSTIARSAGDRLRSDEALQKGDGWLRSGWEKLGPVVNEQRGVIGKKPWSDRIFAQSNWEATASLATRALSALRGGSE